MYKKLLNLSKYLYSYGLKKEASIILKIAEDSQNLKLKVFDFDDTVAETDSKIIVKTRFYKDQNLDEDLEKLVDDNVIYLLTPQELLTHELSPGEEYDYRQFSKIIDPDVIELTENIIKNIQNKNERIMSGVQSGRISKLKVLTARGSDAKEEILNFFQKVLGYKDISEDDVITLGNKDPQAKAQKILEWAASGDYSSIEFFDDSGKNISAVKNIIDSLPKDPNSPSVFFELRQVVEKDRGNHTTIRNTGVATINAIRGVVQ